MQAFSSIDGVVLPIDRANVDTDQIIPKQYLKSIKRTGFGPNLFDDWRYLDPGEPGDDHSQRRLNPDFEINMERYQGAQVLLGRQNFGCGSSREHAPWSLLDYGIRVIIAPSYGDIFYNNCFKNGLLPIIQDNKIVESLFEQTNANAGFHLKVDLLEQTITTPGDEVFKFEIDAGMKHRLMNGLDDIGITLEHADDIRQYEARRRNEAPWLFAELT
ncbi:MAG: 3-isopropylmalate dehydratase small subunit [Arenicellales bacterium]|nr:3-isopropylmalate dehydratase small subunit [Arenicellales bacterium]